MTKNDGIYRLINLFYDNYDKIVARLEKML